MTVYEATKIVEFNREDRQREVMAWHLAQIARPESDSFENGLLNRLANQVRSGWDSFRSWLSQSYRPEPECC